MIEAHRGNNLNVLQLGKLGKLGKLIIKLSKLSTDGVRLITSGCAFAEVQFVLECAYCLKHSLRLLG